jgi:hypothetical protein
MLDELKVKNTKISEKKSRRQSEEAEAGNRIRILVMEGLKGKK